MRDILERASRVKLAIFDVDGVLTDGSLFIGDDGQEYKAFNSRDGHGMVMLRQTGVTLAIITGRSSEVVRIRMASLGINHLYQGIQDKLNAYEELKHSLGLADEATLIREIPKAKANDFMQYAEGRMKKKVMGAVEAIEEGVQQVIFADGRVDAPISRALAGEGTQIG